MAAPPDTYPRYSTQGPCVAGAQPCGSNFDEIMFVTGQICNTQFGTHLQAALDPVADRAQIQDPVRQPDVRQRIQNKILILSKRVNDAQQLNAKERASLIWLLDSAKEELAIYDGIVNRWNLRIGGSWPIDGSDDTIFAVRHGAIPTTTGVPWRQYCGTFSDGEVVRPWPAALPEYSIRCPTFHEQSSLQGSRNSDKREVRDALTDAARKVRCAEYGINRLLLYKQAIIELQQVGTGPFGGPSGLALTPPAETPPDFDIDADALPPVEPEPPLPDADPPPTPAPVPQQPSMARDAALIAGAGVLGAVVSYGVYTLLTR